MKLMLIVMAAVIGIMSATVAQAESRLDKIKSTGTIAIGYRESMMPFSYLDQHQKPVGYGLDICRGIVAALEKNLNISSIKVKLVPVTPSTRIPLLSNQTIDLGCGSATNNAERQKQISFSPTTFVTATRFAALKSSKIKDLSDLKGKTVVATSGSSNLRWLVRANDDQKLGMKIITVDAHPLAFLAVANGRAAAFFTDDVLLAGLVATSHSPKSWMISKGAYTTEPYGILEPKDDPAFKTVVDNVTKTMMKDGTMDRLYTKWFTKPIPPNNVNLNWPMTSELRKAIAHPTDSPDPAVYK